jgi:hypothetical protein
VSGDNEMEPDPLSLHTPPDEEVERVLVEPSQIADEFVVLEAVRGLLSIILSLKFTVSVEPEEQLIMQSIFVTSLLRPVTDFNRTYIVVELTVPLLSLRVREFE